MHVTFDGPEMAMSSEDLKNLDFLSAFENLENLYLCSRGV